MNREWTDADLARLQALDTAGRSCADIAAEMRRGADDIADHLPIARARRNDVGAGDTAEDLEWNGPDEEGDVPPPSGRRDDDPAAWVHRDRS